MAEDRRSSVSEQYVKNLEKEVNLLRMLKELELNPSPPPTPAVEESQPDSPPAANSVNNNQKTIQSQRRRGKSESFYLPNSRTGEALAALKREDKDRWRTRSSRDIDVGATLKASKKEGKKKRSHSLGRRNDVTLFESRHKEKRQPKQRTRPMLHSFSTRNKEGLLQLTETQKHSPLTDLLLETQAEWLASDLVALEATDTVEAALKVTPSPFSSCTIELTSFTALDRIQIHCSSS